MFSARETTSQKCMGVTVFLYPPVTAVSVKSINTHATVKQASRTTCERRSLADSLKAPSRSRRCWQKQSQVGAPATNSERIFFSCKKTNKLKTLIGQTPTMISLGAKEVFSRQDQVLQIFICDSDGNGQGLNWKWAVIRSCCIHYLFKKLFIEHHQT